MNNILSGATDGVPATIGKYKGSISLLKKEFPDYLTMYCVFHRQHLVAKSISLAFNE